MPINEGFARRPGRGMIVRSCDVLEPGLTLFKLGHRFGRTSRQSDLQVVSSPWWFSEGTVEEIMRAARASEERLSDVFRRFGAIAKRWGMSADLIVRATIAAPLIAYVGPGTIQDFRGIDRERGDNSWDMPLWVPSPNVAQIYVPVIERITPEGEIISLAARAYRDIYVVSIDKWQDDFLRKDPGTRWLSRIT